MKLEHPALTVIIPVHNEERILERQSRRLIDYTMQFMKEFEIVFEENGSTDNTLYIIDKLRKKFSFIRFLKLGKADYSAAVISGIKAARGEYCIVIGIDYVDLEVLSRCLRALKNADVVICSKNKGLDKRPLLSRLANRCYNALVRLLFGLRYSDTEGYHGYRTVRVQALIEDIETKAHLCNLWILLKAKKAGLRVDEVPFVVYEQRPSKFMKASRLPYLAAISVIEFIKLTCRGY